MLERNMKWSPTDAGALARLTLVSLIDSCTKCTPLTSMLYIITKVTFEVYLHCFIESVNQRELG